MDILYVMNLIPRFNYIEILKHLLHKVGNVECNLLLISRCWPRSRM